MDGHKNNCWERTMSKELKDKSPMDDIRHVLLVNECNE